MLRLLSRMRGPKVNTRRSSPRAPYRPTLECLESRTLMAARVAATLTPEGVLKIKGTERADEIVVRHLGDQVVVEGVEIRTGDGRVASVSSSLVRRVEVRGLGGSDRIILGDHLGSPEDIRVDARIWGGSGNDLIVGGRGKDTIAGGSGNDRLFGNAGDDLLFGEKGHDELQGGAGQDELEGGRGNDLLMGQQGVDWLFGGAGSDTFYGDCPGVTDVVFGGSGADQFNDFPKEIPLISLYNPRKDLRAGLSANDFRASEGDQLRHCEMESPLLPL